MSGSTDDTLAAVARLLSHVNDQGGDRQARLRDIAALLDQIDTEDVHRFRPVQSWGVGTNHDGLWTDLRVSECSLAGLIHVRGSAAELSIVADRYDIDFSRKLLRVAGPAVPEPQDLSAAAYLVASSDAILSSWWTIRLLKYPDRRPSPHWDAMPDLKLGMALRQPLLGQNRNSTLFRGLGPVLLAAPRVDLEWLAGLAKDIPKAKPTDNALLDILARTLRTFGPGVCAHCSLNHLILGQGADILPRDRQTSLLHTYVDMNNARACMELLEDGHPLNLRDRRRHTAAELARRNGSELEPLLRSWEARRAAASALSAALSQPEAGTP